MPRLSRSVVSAAAIPGATGVTLLARVRGATGLLITQASLTSIAWTASNLTTGAALGTGTFTVASSVFDSLIQADPRWTVDSAAQPGPDGSWGYNFLATLAASTFPLATLAVPNVIAGPLGPQQVQVDVAFAPVAGQAWRVTWKWNQLATYG